MTLQLPVRLVAWVWTCFQSLTLSPSRSFSLCSNSGRSSVWGVPRLNHRVEGEMCAEWKNMPCVVATSAGSPATEAQEKLQAECIWDLGFTWRMAFAGQKQGYRACAMPRGTARLLLGKWLVAQCGCTGDMGFSRMRPWRGALRPDHTSWMRNSGCVVSKKSHWVTSYLVTAGVLVSYCCYNKLPHT